MDLTNACPPSTAISPPPQIHQSTVAIPHLLDDILSEVPSHFFTFDIDAPTPDHDSYEIRARVCASVGHSIALVLVSHRFHDLVEPFIWRSVLINRPSDFVPFFAPKTGLLRMRGQEGAARPGWVRELVLGRDAAVPLDQAKNDREIDKEERFVFGFRPTLVLPSVSALIPCCKVWVLVVPGEAASTSPSAAEPSRVL